MITFLVSALIVLTLLGYAYFWVRVVIGLTTALLWGPSAAPVGQPSFPGAFPPYAR